MRLSVRALIFLVVLTLGGLLSACGSAQPTSTPTLEAYPAPLQVATDTSPYPGPGGAAVNPYPGPSSGNVTQVDWAKAEETLLAGQVVQVYVNRAGYVTLVLKDNSVLQTLAPAPDEVSKVLERCGDTCKDVQVTQE